MRSSIPTRPTDPACGRMASVPLASVETSAVDPLERLSAFPTGSLDATRRGVVIVVAAEEPSTDDPYGRDRSGQDLMHSSDPRRSRPADGPFVKPLAHKRIRSVRSLESSNLPIRITGKTR